MAEEYGSWEEDYGVEDWQIFIGKLALWCGREELVVFLQTWYPHIWEGVIDVHALITN